MRTSIRWWRLLGGLIVGVLVGIVTADYLGPLGAILAGWAAGAGFVAAWILLAIWRFTGDQTRTHSTQEDPGRRVARLVELVGCVASLVAVGVVVVQARHADGALQAWLAVVVVLAVVASWFLIQTDTILRLARMYYSDPEGGIDFNQKEPPCYADFAYIAFGVGLTYQIADTNVQTTPIRRVIVAQSLLGYLFGAVILGSIINLITSLG